MQADQPTLRHMIKQMILVGFDGASLDSENPFSNMIQNDVGGVIAFDYDAYNASTLKNIESPKQTASLNQQCQVLNPTAYRAVDCEGGDYIDAAGKRHGVNRLKAAHGFASTLCAQEVGALVAQGEIAQAQAALDKLAQVVADAGFNLVFGPVVDVNVNPNSPVIGALGRSYSADPKVVAQSAALFIDAFAKYGIQTCLKHYPGHGSAAVDSHLGMTDITDTFQEIELEPYRALANQCGMVMIAHVFNRKIDASMPASLSKQHIDYLRHDLNFEGVVIADDLQMLGVTHAIEAHYGENVDLHSKLIQHALEAGNDMLMFCNNLVPGTPQLPAQIEQTVLDLIEQGLVTQERIEQSYQRISKLKHRIGIELEPQYDKTTDA